MTRHRLALLPIGTVAAVASLYAQAPPAVAARGAPLTRATMLPSADLRADLAILRRAYQELHPGLHRYATPGEVAERFEGVDRYFGIDRTLGEAFVALTRLTASIKCGHSYPNFFNQPTSIREALFEGRDKLPFAFRWVARQMVVTEGVAPAGLPRGTVILAIDGVATEAILDSLLPLARADGGNDAKRVAYLEVRGAERYHAFDVLYPLVFPVRDSSFALVVRRPGGPTAEELRLAAIDGAQRRAATAVAEELAPDAPRWSYEEQEGIGLLRMPTWALYDSKWDYRRWTDSLMNDLATRGVKDLVLDLRENEGGVDAGNAILAHLIGQPLSLPRYRRFVRYRRVPDDLTPVLDTWDQSFRDWGEAAVGPEAPGLYRLTRWDGEDGDAFLQPSGRRFRGRVWVLVGAVNSSATFQFALAVKESGVAQLVGQPTGGNRRGINGGAFFFVRLPRTGLEVDLPLVAGFPVTPQPDEGVTPDILVTPSVADIASGRDSELAAVRAWIRRGASDARSPYYLASGNGSDQKTLARLRLDHHPPFGFRGATSTVIAGTATRPRAAVHRLPPMQPEGDVAAEPAEGKGNP